ncbi:MAG: hypothetical protein ABJ065_08625, partial [Marinobacter sp.]
MGVTATNSGTTPGNDKNLIPKEIRVKNRLIAHNKRTFSNVRALWWEDMSGTVKNMDVFVE